MNTISRYLSFSNNDPRAAPSPTFAVRPHIAAPVASDRLEIRMLELGRLKHETKVGVCDAQELGIDGCMCFIV